MTAPDTKHHVTNGQALVRAKSVRRAGVLRRIQTAMSSKRCANGRVTGKHRPTPDREEPLMHFVVGRSEAVTSAPTSGALFSATSPRIVGLPQSVDPPAHRLVAVERNC